MFQNKAQHPPTSSVCTSDVHSTPPPARKTQSNVTAQYTNCLLCTQISKLFGSPEIQTTLFTSSCTIYILSSHKAMSSSLVFLLVTFTSPNVLDVFQVKRNAPFRSCESSFQFNFFFCHLQMRKLMVLPQTRRKLLQVSQLRAATTNPSTLTADAKKSPITKNHYPALLFLLSRVTNRTRG